MSSGNHSDLMPSPVGDPYPKQQAHSMEDIISSRKQLRLGQIPTLTNVCPITQYE